MCQTKAPADEPLTGVMNLTGNVWQFIDPLQAAAYGGDHEPAESAREKINGPVSALAR